MPNSWWQSAAIYQLYPRSFADGNGDGIGDLAGARARLPYLEALGIDAIWFNPWYPSPMADGGYDIIDYRSIDPVFGTLAEADALIAEAHGHGIRIIVDVVPNHSSDEAPWFREALAAGPGSPARARYWFRPGRGAAGELAPNNWQSMFGGPAWTRVTEPDGTPGEWYLHLFDRRQPDFNWGSADVRREFEDVLRFWFARGADGIRIDSAALLSKDAALPDVAEGAVPGPAHPYVDRDEVHDIYRSWRAIADSFGADGRGERMLIGEVWVPDAARLARYASPSELHTVFNFPYLGCPWDAAALRAVIDQTLQSGGPPTWVLSNHDVDRVVSRYGRPDTAFDFTRRAYFHRLPVDLALGTRRARAAALLTMALPGSVYVYQGEELGLWEVQDIPDALRQDPTWARTNGADPGRDGCRVPLPWAGTEPPFGFTPPGAAADPWLSQPKQWRELTVAAETDDPDSMLALYRAALQLRRTAFGGGSAGTGSSGTGPLAWQPSPDGVLAFDRTAADGSGPAVRCVANLSAAPAELPPHGTVLLASGPLADGLLPPETTVWLRL